MRDHSDMSMRRNTQLLQSEAQFRAALDNAPIGMALVSLEGRFTRVNAALCRIVGYAEHELMQLTFQQITVAEDLDLDLGNLQRLVDGAANSYKIEKRYIRKDGTVIWVQLTASVLRDANGQLLQFVAQIEDIQERKEIAMQLERTGQRLRESEERFRLMVDAAVDYAIILLDEHGQVASWNLGAERMYGYAADDIMGKSLHCVYTAEDQNAGIPDQDLRHASASGRTDFEGWRVCRNGRRIWVNMVLTVLKDANQKLVGYTKMSRDLTDRKSREVHTQHIAHHDYLTGLPNRVLLNDRLEQAIRRASREVGFFGVMMLDLDHFKRVNDSLGHHIGDELLKVVSARLVECVRESDTVARMGGDEFVVLLPSMANASGVTRVAQAIVRSISQTISIGAHELSVTPSVGVAMYPQDGTNANALLKNADTAMYQAKAAGRACYEIFNVELETKAVNDLQIENELRVALRRGELQMHYQPQVCLGSGEVIGVEALIRWKHPSKGLIPPADFIRIAENTGLILPISEWILKTACAECLEIQKHTGTALMLAINLSPRQLENGRLCGVLRETLKQTGFNPEHLELEITEGVLMEHIEDAKVILDEIQTLGVKIAIDDFGTGFSSLSYLTQLPINTLKIDRCFVQKSTLSGRDAAVVNAILALAQSLDLRVIAEGVETIEQLEYLMRRQCHAAQGALLGAVQPAERFCVQGYLVSKALPAMELVAQFQAVERSSRNSMSSAAAH